MRTRPGSIRAAGLQAPSLCTRSRSAASLEAPASDPSSFLANTSRSMDRLDQPLSDAPMPRRSGATSRSSPYSVSLALPPTGAASPTPRLTFFTLDLCSETRDHAQQTTLDHGSTIDTMRMPPPVALVVRGLVVRCPSPETLPRRTRSRRPASSSSRTCTGTCPNRTSRRSLSKSDPSQRRISR